MKIAGAVALVTGASSGIGAVTALELAKRGAKVILVARRGDRLAEQVAAIEAAGGEGRVLEADISDLANVERLARDAEALYGRIDILVNNAGVGSGPNFPDRDPATIGPMVNTNLASPILLTRLLLPGMLQRRSGSVIFVASVAAHIPTNPMYSASKFGLRGFALALRRSIRRTGIDVSVVSPGYVRTELTAWRGNQRMPGPHIVANAIVGLVERPRREVVTPFSYRLAIALEMIAPGLMDRALPAYRYRG